MIYDWSDWLIRVIESLTDYKMAYNKNKNIFR